MASGRNLNPKQALLLQKHLAFCCALESGQRQPKIDAQRHFVLVCRRRADPTSAHKRVYLTHRQLQSNEPPPLPLPKPNQSPPRAPIRADKPKGSHPTKRPRNPFARKTPKLLMDAQAIERARTRGARRLGKFDTSPVPSTSQVRTVRSRCIEEEKDRSTVCTANCHVQTGSGTRTRRKWVDVPTTTVETDQVCCHEIRYPPQEYKPWPVSTRSC